MQVYHGKFKSSFQKNELKNVQQIFVENIQNHKEKAKCWKKQTLTNLNETKCHSTCINYLASQIL